MGLCQSQESSRSSRGNKKGGKGANKRRNDKRHEKRRKRRYSSSESSEHTTESDSSSEDERTDRKRRNHKDRGDRHDDEKEPHQPGSPFRDGRVVDSAAYALQYPVISKEDQDILFYNARTCTRFAAIPIPHEMLRNAMKLALLAPSAYNCCPMRVVFVMNENTSAKDKLLSCLDPEGLRQTQEAPVTAIVCTDLHYTHNLPKLMPYVPNAQQMFEQYDDLNEMIRIRNSNLQAGYLILALRSLGLGVGPLSNFDNEKCDQLFLENSTWRSNFLINLGYAKDDQYPPRAYRLEFDVAAKLL